jgi:hypothetical protein
LGKLTTLPVLESRSISVETLPRNSATSCLHFFRPHRDVRLKSAKWAKAEIDLVAVTNRDFYEYTLQGFASSR